MKKHNKTGRLLYYTGTYISAFGIAFELVEDTPDPLSIIAMPLIIIGVVLLIVSNFFRKDNKDRD
ncbi:hypothetical protein [Oceanobacillus sp. Castelsardo]|uniref:hypothetical protein n=1 Tax=Oceanobacillus sp. Castelsardo TaxID=1851204 RepID=UPI00083904F2|nr:hypothetical protein [Oceanobacillus sp. Castelsardo]